MINAVWKIIYTTFQKFRVGKIFLCFWKIYLHLLDQKHYKYYYNLKYLFSILIHFKM